MSSRAVGEHAGAPVRRRAEPGGRHAAPGPRSDPASGPIKPKPRTGSIRAKGPRTSSRKSNRGKQRGNASHRNRPGAEATGKPSTAEDREHDQSTPEPRRTENGVKPWAGAGRRAETVAMRCNHARGQRVEQEMQPDTSRSRDHEGSTNTGPSTRRRREPSGCRAVEIGVKTQHKPGRRTAETACPTTGQTARSRGWLNQDA